MILIGKSGKINFTSSSGFASRLILCAFFSLVLPIAVNAQGKVPKLNPSPQSNNNKKGEDRTPPAKTPKPNNTEQAKPKPTPAKKPPPASQKCQKNKAFPTIIVVLPDNYKKIAGDSALSVKLEGGDKPVEAAFKNNLAFIRQADKKKSLIICEDNSDYKLVFYKKTGDTTASWDVLLGIIGINGASDYNMGFAVINYNNVSDEINIDIKPQPSKPFEINFKFSDGNPAEVFYVKLLDKQENVLASSDSKGNSYSLTVDKPEEITAIQFQSRPNVTETHPITAADREAMAKTMELDTDQPPSNGMYVIIWIAVFAALVSIFGVAFYLYQRESERKTAVSHNQPLPPGNGLPDSPPAQNPSHPKEPNDIEVTISAYSETSGETIPEFQLAADSNLPIDNSPKTDNMETPPPDEPPRTIETVRKVKFDYDNEDDAAAAYLELISNGEISEMPVILDISEDQESGEFIFLDRTKSRKAPFILFTADGENGWIFPRPSVVSITHDTTLQRIFTDLTKDKFSRHKTKIKPAQAKRAAHTDGKNERWRVNRKNIFD